MDLTQPTSILAKFSQCVNVESVVQLAMVQEDMEDESETKQNLLYVLLLRQYTMLCICALTEIILTDWHDKIRIKGIFKTQLFVHKQPNRNNIYKYNCLNIYICLNVLEMIESLPMDLCVWSVTTSVKRLKIKLLAVMAL